MQNGNGARFSWDIDPRTPVSTVSFTGECDLFADVAIAEVEDSVPMGATAVLLDLAHLSFIDSTGLRRLILLRKNLGERGAKLVIARVSESAQRIFEAAGVASFFEYADGRRRSWRAVFRDSQVRKKNGLATP
jgi:anti-anti-sigma factor